MHDDDGNGAGRPNRARLFEVASEQGGYFTAAQARARGFSKALLAHHAKSGRFIRVRQGLYRFREYPSSTREDVVAAWLATGKEVAAVICSGAVPVSAASMIDRAAAVTRIPSRTTTSDLPRRRVVVWIAMPGNLER